MARRDEDIEGLGSSLQAARAVALRAKWLTGVSAALTVASLSTVAAWNWSETQRKDKERIEAGRFYAIEARASADQDRASLAILKARQHEAEVQVQSILSARVTASSSSKEQQEILARTIAAEKGLQDVKARITQLDDLIGDDPEKRMSLILLTKDLQQTQRDHTKDLGTLHDEYKSDLASLREDSKSNFEFVKWALGLVGISNLLGPALSFFSNRPVLPVATAKDGVRLE